jgi:amino acid transporter
MVFEAATGRSPAFIGAIAVAATLNGVLAQIIMASRVLYGLGGRSAAFAWARALHPTRRTPTRATALATVCVIALALAAPLASLAEATSAILLGVFTLVNAALVVLKRRGPPPRGAPNLPAALPVFAALTSAGLLVASLWAG